MPPIQLPQAWDDPIFQVSDSNLAPTMLSPVKAPLPVASRPHEDELATNPSPFPSPLEGRGPDKWRHRRLVPVTCALGSCLALAAGFWLWPTSSPSAPAEPAASPPPEERVRAAPPPEADLVAPLKPARPRHKKRPPHHSTLLSERR